MYYNIRSVTYGELFARSICSSLLRVIIESVFFESFNETFSAGTELVLIDSRKPIFPASRLSPAIEPDLIDMSFDE